LQLPGVVRAELEEMEPGYGRSGLGDTLAAVAEAVEAEREAGGAGGSAAVVAVLSGFERGLADLERPVPEAAQGLGERAKLVVSRPAVGSGNAQVQALRPRRALVLLGGDGSAAGGRAAVELTVRRFDDTTGPAEATVNVLLRNPEGEIVAEASRAVAWSAGQARATVSVDLPLEPDASGLRGNPAESSVGVGGVWGIEAVLERGGALAEDDRRWATVTVRSQLNVGVIDPSPGSSGLTSGGGGGGGFGPRAFVAAALSPEPTGQRFAVHAQPVRPTEVDPARLGSLDAVLVLRPDLLGAPGWSALASFAQRGGLVWVFPPPEAPPGSGNHDDWFDLMTTTLNVDWQLDDPVIADAAEVEPSRIDLDQPVPEALVLLSADWDALWGPVRFERRLPLKVESPEQAWVRVAGADDDGNVLLAAAPVGAGRLLWMGVAVDPAWTNLGTKPVFPALLHDALRGTLGADASGGTGSVVVGDTPTLGPGFAGATALVKDGQRVPVGRGVDDDDAARVLSPVVEPGLYTAVTSAGLEAASATSGGGGGKVAVNVPAEAGDVRASEPAQREAWLAQLGPTTTLDDAAPAAVLTEAVARADLGWALLWVLLGLVLLEMMLARWTSHAGVAESKQAIEPRVSRPKRRWAIRGRRAALWFFALAVTGLQAVPSQAGWLDRALGLDTVSLDEATALGWRYPLPAWAWVLIVAAALCAAWFSYRRLLGPTWVRGLLAGFRGVLIVLLAVLLAGPQVVRTDETVQQDVLIVLVDRSASMGVADVPAEVGGEAGLVSRDAALRDALTAKGQVFGPEQLGRGRQVAWLGFGQRAFDLPALVGGEAVAGLDEPAEPGTSLRGALEQALRRAAGRPISGVVVLTDGRSPEPTGRSLLERFERESVQVFPVPLGAERLPLDLELTRVEPPTAAFINDPVPVTVVVERPGFTASENHDGAIDPARVTVRLIDTQTQDVIDERTLEGVGLGQPLRLQGRSSRAGEHPWAVQVRYDDPEGEAELNLANNDEAFVVEMIDRPIRVLYVEGYPRWQYRYLKNMLIREGSIDSSVFLLSADRAFAQEGDTPITRLPTSAEEWRRYDVVIVGDVPAEAFSPEQRQQLYDLVAQRGAGVLWVGGPLAMPTGYGGTMLADLLPMREPEAVGPVPLGEMAVRPTALAEALSVLQLTLAAASSPRGADAAASGERWPDDLSPLRWVQDLGALKPSAEVLARVAPAASADAEAFDDPQADPLVTRLRFGAGQSLYVGTDETWRWRYARGEVYFEQFWVQLVRLLGRGAAARGEDPVRLEVSSRRVPQGGTVVVRLEMEDAALIARDLPSLRVAVFGPEAGDEASGGSATSGAGAPLAEFDLRPGEGEAGRGLRRYSAPYRADTAGELRLVVTEPALAGYELSAPLDVIAPDDELRRAEADRPRLVQLAAATGGQVIELDHLERLAEPGVVPNLARQTANDVAEPIANSALALGLILGLLTLEWVVRKLVRLV
jgi:hypothetical protein